MDPRSWERWPHTVSLPCIMLCWVCGFPPNGGTWMDWLRQKEKTPHLKSLSLKALTLYLFCQKAWGWGRIFKSWTSRKITYLVSKILFIISNVTWLSPHGPRPGWKRCGHPPASSYTTVSHGSIPAIRRAKILSSHFPSWWQVVINLSNRQQHLAYTPCSCLHLV